VARILTIAVTLLAGVVHLCAEDPEPPTLDRWQGKKLYDERYAERRKAVDETPETDDDVGLAAEHLKDLTRYNQDTTVLRLVLCEQAFDLGMRHRDGYATAIEAAEKLLGDYPELRDEYLPKAIDAHHARYRAKRTHAPQRERLIELYVEQARRLAGKDRFDGAFAALVNAHGIASTVKSPRRDEILALRRYYQVRRDPAGGGADLGRRKEAILMAVRELDAPAEAATLLVDELDEQLRTCIPLAAKAQKDVPLAACLGLGNWYLELVAGASPRGKRICLIRAKGYLERVFAAHEGKDESGVKAGQLLAQVDSQLAAMTPVIATGGAPEEKPPAKRPEGETP
jgi:hypothetical protein